MTTSKKTSYLGARSLFGDFITYLFSPRKKNILIERKAKRQVAFPPHQGEQEKARRRAQIAKGMHRDCREVRS